jgi:hypothetical protein
MAGASSFTRTPPGASMNLPQASDGLRANSALHSPRNARCGGADAD